MRERARALEEMLREGEARAAQSIATAERKQKEAEERLAAADAERKLLLDRVVQMSGQPPLYAEQVSVPNEQVPANQPAPKARVTFEDIHGAFREAELSGKLTLVNGRAVAARA